MTSAYNYSYLVNHFATVGHVNTVHVCNCTFVHGLSIIAHWFRVLVICCNSTAICNAQLLETSSSTRGGRHAYLRELPTSHLSVLCLVIIYETVTPFLLIIARFICINFIQEDDLTAQCQRCAKMQEVPV